QPQYEYARELLDRGCGAVVEHRHGAVGLPPGVVLPREPHAWAEPEVALLAAEAPQHLAGAVADLVDGVRVAARDQQVAVRLLVDRVEVEVVVGEGLRAELLARRLGVRLLHPDPRIAVPLEQDSPGRAVDLLHDPVPDQAVLRAADRR